MIRDVELKEVNNLRGGRGTVKIYHVLTPEELYGHGRLYARIILPAGSSVGWHEHLHDTEPYYILKGEADFYEGDSENGERRKFHVKAGQVCLINIGQWHSLENNSDSDLEFMALIYNEPGYLL